MSPATIAAISACIAALGTLLTGVAVVITAARTKDRLLVAADKLAVKTDETSAKEVQKLDEIHEQGGVIHDLVNSRLTAALERIEAQDTKIGHLEARLGDEPGEEVKT